MHLHYKILHPCDDRQNSYELLLIIAITLIVVHESANLLCRTMTEDELFDVFMYCHIFLWWISLFKVNVDGNDTDHKWWGIQEGHSSLQSRTESSKNCFQQPWIFKEQPVTLEKRLWEDQIHKLSSVQYTLNVYIKANNFPSVNMYTLLSFFVEKLCKQSHWTYVWCYKGHDIYFNFTVSCSNILF